MESNMIRVTVAQTTVKEVKGVSKVSGKPYEMRFQTGYAHTVDKEGNVPPYPEKFEIMLDKDQAAYAPGDYQLHPSSVYVNRDGRADIAVRLTALTKKPA
jgi:hypothetical protein